MDEALSIYNKVAAAGFPFMLFLALVGSRVGFFYWSREYEALKAEKEETKRACAAQKAEYDQRLLEEKEEGHEREARLIKSVAAWQEVALSSTSGLEKAAEILRRAS